MSPLPPSEVYIDGASRGNPGPAGIGVVFLDGHGKPRITVRKYLGETTNNIAEYLALVYALEEARRRGLTELAVKTDSELLAKQFNGQYKVRDQHLRLFHDLARHMAQGFEKLSITHIPRTQNTRADRLAAEAVKAPFDFSVKIVETEG